MQFICIAGISFILYCVVKKLCSLMKMECQVLYLLFGVLIGVFLQWTKFKSIDQIFPGIMLYNNMALLFVFFVSGFSIQLRQLLKSGPVTAKLFSIPAYVETFIMAGILMLLTPFRFIEALLISSIFAMASPANIVSSCVQMIRSGNVGKNNLPSTMIMATIVDSFITIPIVFSCIFIFIQQGASVFQVIKILIIILLGILIAILVGVAIGRLELIGLQKVFKKIHSRTIQMQYVIILIAFLMALLLAMVLKSVHVIEKAVIVFGILIMFGIGLSINHFDISGVNKIIASHGNMLFAMFGMPAIFTYVGSIIDISIILDMKLLIVLIAITVLAVVIKGWTTRRVLKGNTYSSAERKFASYCYIPKGVALINFSMIFGAILGNENPIVVFMRMLATIGILTTMTIGIPKIKKSKLE